MLKSDNKTDDKNTDVVKPSNNYDNEANKAEYTGFYNPINLDQDDESKYNSLKKING